MPSLLGKETAQWGMRLGCLWTFEGMVLVMVALQTPICLPTVHLYLKLRGAQIGPALGVASAERGRGEGTS